MEAVKEMLDALAQRIRSPIIGSVAVVFAVVNWQPIWYLLFADRPVRQKFLYFNNNTDICSLYVWPILIGIFFAITAPWLKYAGAWFASKPVFMLRNLQNAEAHKLQMAEFQREVARERGKAEISALVSDRVVETAKKQQEVRDLGAPELAEEIVASTQEVAREPSGASTHSGKSRIATVMQELSEVDLLVLRLVKETENIGNDPGNYFSWLPDDVATSLVEQLSRIQQSDVSIHRAQVDMQSSVERLKMMGLVTRDSVSVPYQGGSHWTLNLTSDGYSILDQISREH